VNDTDPAVYHCAWAREPGASGLTDILPLRITSEAATPTARNGRSYRLQNAAEAIGRRSTSRCSASSTDELTTSRNTTGLRLSRGHAHSRPRMLARSTATITGDPWRSRASLHRRSCGETSSCDRGNSCQAPNKSGEGKCHGRSAGGHRGCRWSTLQAIGAALRLHHARHGGPTDRRNHRCVLFLVDSTYRYLPSIGVTHQ
jgi:uncharacterized low-complexity protein